MTYEPSTASASVGPPISSAAGTSVGCSASTRGAVSVLTFDAGSSTGASAAPASPASPSVVASADGLSDGSSYGSAREDAKNLWGFVRTFRISSWLGGRLGRRLHSLGVRRWLFRDFC